MNGGKIIYLTSSCAAAETWSGHQLFVSAPPTFNGFYSETAHKRWTIALQQGEAYMTWSVLSVEVGLTKDVETVK